MINRGWNPRVRKHEELPTPKRVEREENNNKKKYKSDQYMSTLKYKHNTSGVAQFLITSYQMLTTWLFVLEPDGLLLSAISYRE